jgi:hypothetical protein
VEKRTFDRVVIGGGLFGAYSALVLEKQGHSVLLVEQNSELMSRASYVNQARLHTGLHYPRSLVTARESLRYYKTFRDRFPSAIFDFNQIYAIASHNSKTSSQDFRNFISRLGIDYQIVEANQYFQPGTVDLAVKVDEPTFDAHLLRQLILDEIESTSNIELCMNTAVTGGRLLDNGTNLVLSDGSMIYANGVVIAAYAGTNAVRNLLGLPNLPLTYELAEIILGSVNSELEGIGITVMDGPFWSMMPFGNTGSVSLTSVGMTPLQKSHSSPVFNCQSLRAGCSPLSLADCNTCTVRPATGLQHQIQQMQMFMNIKDVFTPIKSLLTVKTILSTTEVDDARPTMIHQEPDSKIWTVFSGKVSTLFDLEEVLQ